ncbi:vicilin-like seed storage protein At2g18540 [Papaver somniferum]|uniref:vicilin-like seed storage protein At2g18540 n=1 Tax=Papaver somniferum TaxID=3469 RepID=UPI000E6FE8C6|nr:vicilin-like seed storage protein At2g18540 [Papaver somniferum]
MEYKDSDLVPSTYNIYGFNKEDEEEINETKVHIEEHNNAIQEEGGQVNQKTRGKSKKGKVVEGNEMTKNKRETPTTKEKQIPREGGKMNRSRGKRVQGQEAEESIEIQNLQNKFKDSREDEEMAQLKEELYEERRRKQADSDIQEERYAMGRSRTEEKHYARKREGLGQGEQKEREDLKKAIESSRREFREREYQMQ